MSSQVNLIFIKFSFYLSDINRNFIPHYNKKMIEGIKPFACPKETKFCCIELRDKRASPQASAERQWTRIAPMGSLLNPPRVIPPMKSTSDQCNQTNILIKEPVTVPRRPIIPRDYDVNARMKTMYQYHFNDSGDTLLGYCDNRTVTERITNFRNCQRVQDDLLQAIKNGGRGSIRRYKSNYNKRISEYMAETSFIGGKIIKSRIHDHSQCGASASRCIHSIDF